MPHYIIGTAGHVDHGKTELIKALTGIDTDRLKEEKERGLTLDLGFAHIKLPSGIICGIVDVPGHKQYLKNMLAGVGGYDFVLLVIDCVEGIKEQTVEHLEIVEIMGIPAGVCVITKIDKASSELLEKRKDEISNFLKGTFLENSPIIPVSSVTGEGIMDLIKAIDKEIVKVSPKNKEGHIRLPIDRVFTKSGFGTIVTGTLYSGTISIDQKIEVLPPSLSGRVRNIQVYNRNVKQAFAGQRVALNLTKIESSKIRRGDEVLSPKVTKPTSNIDVKIKVLPSSPHPLKNRDKVQFFISTKRTFGHVILLDADEIPQGKEGFARIKLQSPVVAFYMDSFIIRSPSAIYTIGGGKVLDPHPQYHRRFDKKVIELLKIKEKQDTESLLNIVMDREPFVLYDQDSLAEALSMSLPDTIELINRLEKEGKIHRLTSGRIILKSTFERLLNNFIDVLKELQEIDPKLTGRHSEEVKKNLPSMEERLFREICIHLEKEGRIRKRDNHIILLGFKPKLNKEEKECISWIEKKFASSGFSPPSKKEILEQSPFKRNTVEEVIKYLVLEGKLVPISDNILMESEKIEKAKRIVGNFIVKHGVITPSQARQILSTTRKYVIPLLEYFDKIYFTRRTEKGRVFFRENIIVK